MSCFASDVGIDLIEDKGDSSHNRVSVFESSVTKYGGKAAISRRWKGMCLHAWRLAFIHPHTGKRLFFETSLPFFATDRTSITDNADKVKENDIRRSTEAE